MSMIWKQVGAAVAGVVVGMAVNMALVIINTKLYPMPEGTDMKDPQAMAQYVAGLPMPAFAMVLAAHGLGMLVGAALATWLAPDGSLIPALIVLALTVLGGVANLFMVPHPGWFATVDLLCYPLCAALGIALGRLLRG